MMDHYFDTVMLHDCCMNCNIGKRKSRRMNFYVENDKGVEKNYILEWIKF